MPFDLPGMGTTLSPSEQFDRKCANKLLEAVQRKHKIMRNPSIPSWSKEFATLRRQVGKEQITKTLEWYVHHIGKEYVPQAYSAKSFRLRFHQIVEAAGRNEEVEYQQEISQEAYTIAKRCAFLWPMEEKQDELLCIQISLTNYAKYRARLLKLTRATREAGNKRELRLLNHLLTLDVSTTHFVEWWMRDLHKMAWSWGPWRGKLLRWVFQPTGRKFEEYIRKVIANYCGDAGRWESIKEGLKTCG